MSRLARFTQLIFGSSAGTNEMAQYGSFAAGSPLTYSGTTITPAIVQGIGNYLNGWFAAVEGAYSPAIEDMNALCYLFAFQLAYLMQQGIAEYDSATTYYTGSLVQSAGITYVSLTNSNLGNALTDATNWYTPTQNGTLMVHALPSSRTLPANKTLMWPNLQIGNGQTVTVPNNANLVAITNITMSGTGSLVITGTGVVRVI